MKTIYPFCLFIFAVLSMANDCGQGQLSEQQLVNLSVECFNNKYNPDLHDGHKLARIIDSRVVAYKKILQHIKMHKKKHIQTTPVVKWAQTKQKIFVNFKLSHRQDSPPCSDVRNQHFIIQNIETVQGKFKIEKVNNETNSSKINFQSQCFFTDQKFMYKLTLSFNSSLKSMNIDRQGFGSYTLVGDKQEPQIWIDPFEDVQKAAIWQQMRQRYTSQMDQYFKMRQNRFEEKSRKKNKKRPKTKQTQNKQSKQTEGQL